ncbi:hypothetical protein BC938DRAFT_476779 [Jimgerdemannia flammicorona]|uniref:Nitrogen regulatory protein areA GATA-like domain-containing protein n=1 Tax=Jimgerdemannia flammicorona TaxID=994334 RepID=A0A433QQ71_9FUNG|nr:hypothetical protein BC938DRAFT_476779 [Jimgerdemannia flammicorona]
MPSTQPIHASSGKSRHRSTHSDDDAEADHHLSRSYAEGVPQDMDSPKLSAVLGAGICVDYLSYNFDEMDLAASWKVMTKQKKDIVNGIRLENASWRTWWKKKNGLKTISPEMLNWLKDSDVTWLYGPLHTMPKKIDKYSEPKQASTFDKLGLMKANMGLKPALKKKSLSDILRSPSSGGLFKSPSDSSLQEEGLTASKDVINAHRQPTLRFNDSVEQCIAVSDEDDVEEESSDDDAIIMNICPKRTTSIVKLEPTRLKLSDSPRGGNRRRSQKSSRTARRSYSTEDVYSQSSSNWNSGTNMYDDDVDILQSTVAWGDDDDDEDYFFSPSSSASAASSAPSTPPDTPTESAAKGDPTDFHSSTGGLTGTAINIVTNVVHWASSLVFNSGVFY